MQGVHDKQIEDASQILAEDIAAGQSDPRSRAQELDGYVMELLRRLGLREKGAVF